MTARGKRAGGWIATLALLLGGVACGGGKGNGSGAAGGGGGGGDGGAGGGTSPPASAIVVTGSLPLSAANATSLAGSASCTAQGASFSVAVAAVLASDQPDLCGYVERNQEKASTRAVLIALSRVDPSNGPVAVDPGSYPIVPSPTNETAFAYAVVSQTDAACTSSDVAATGGTVVVSAAPAGRLQGTVDVLLADGGQVTGAFDAAVCPVTLGDVCTGAVGPVSPTCAP